uniref:Uncharacterized protein n=1 Tax=Anopheles atroparvus TaxID=41427 RepID=A0A182IUR5_ANOAO
VTAAARGDRATRVRGDNHSRTAPPPPSPRTRTTNARASRRRRDLLYRPRDAQNFAYALAAPSRTERDNAPRTQSPRTRSKGEKEIERESAREKGNACERERYLRKRVVREGAFAIFKPPSTNRGASCGVAFVCVYYVVGCAFLKFAKKIHPLTSNTRVLPHKKSALKRVRRAYRAKY